MPKCIPIVGPSVSTSTILPARRTPLTVVSSTAGTNPGGATRSSTQASVIRRPTVTSIAERQISASSPSGTAYKSDLLATARKRSSGPASWSPLIRNASCPWGESISKYSALPPAAAAVSAI